MLKCNYAWGHLDFLQGEYAPCFRYKIKKQPIASMSDTLPSEAVNCSSMQEVRATLQRGEFPAGCEDCAYKEANGVTSYREKSLRHDWGCDFTKTTVPGIVDLELKFSRTCNYLCRHCMSDSNSQFELLGSKNQELHEMLLKHGFDHIGKADSPIQTVNDEQVEDIINNILPTVRHITFSGGEPLYHLKHYRFLERLINEGLSKNLTIGYNTNMSMIRFKSFDLAELWKHFAGVELTVSMDGTGEIFNYFRQNGNYDQTVENLFTVLKQCKNIRSVYLVCTSTSYHAFYADEIFNDLHELVDKIKATGVPAHTDATFVHYPAGLDIANLDQRVKDRLNQTMSADNPIIKYMQTPAYADTKTFKHIVRWQDLLYYRVAPERIAEFVYNDKIII